MNRFDYVRPATLADAVTAAAEPGATYLAGGTNLLDLMKGYVETPTRLTARQKELMREFLECCGESQHPRERDFRRDRRAGDRRHRACLRLPAHDGGA